MKGIDVAKWNGIIDWKKVKGSGVKFAILKIINKQCKVEDAFERNYAGAKEQELPVSVYNYSYATNVSKAVQDANTVISIAKGKDIEYIWLDVEDKCQQNLGMTLIDIINAYQSIIERAGYKFGVYTGLSFYNTLIRPFHNFVNCPFWIARYPSGAVMDFETEPWEDKKPNIIHSLFGWQYTSKGRINGISGNVDFDIEYADKVEGNGQIHSQNGIATYSLKADGDKQVSTNFKVKEFRCKDGSDRILIDVDFVRNKLQAIRDHFAAPVTINSAYRTQTYNKKVGGAARSYHLTGQAFDIVVKGHTPAEVARCAQSLDINGIIQYNTFVHIDSREVKYWSINNNGKVTKVSSF